MAYPAFDVIDRIIGVHHIVQPGRIRHELHQTHGAFVGSSRRIEIRLGPYYGPDQVGVELLAFGSGFYEVFVAIGGRKRLNIPVCFPDDPAESLVSRDVGESEHALLVLVNEDVRVALDGEKGPGENVKQTEKKETPRHPNRLKVPSRISSPIFPVKQVKPSVLSWTYNRAGDVRLESAAGFKKAASLPQARLISQ